MISFCATKALARNLPTEKQSSWQVTVAAATIVTANKLPDGKWNIYKKIIFETGMRSWQINGWKIEDTWHD